MTTTAAPTSTPGTSTSWENEIRELEERGRIAFLAGDTATLAGMWDEGFLVNSPLEMINDRAGVLGLLASGRIRHTEARNDIERIARYGDVVVVMGRDAADGPPHGKLVYRRFTNVWQRQGGEWKMIARHAQLVASQPA